MNPLLATDSYKQSHREQYPEGTELVYSNLTPRSLKYLTRINGINSDKIVNFGIQAFIKKFLIEAWNRYFFQRDKSYVLQEFERIINAHLGNDGVGVKQIEELYDLGYLPICIRALPEGVEVNEKIPLLTIYNTKKEFYWLTNYLETSLSACTWKALVAATISRKFREVVEYYSEETGGNKDFVNIQCHDFSARGLSGVEDMGVVGSAHLLNFIGTDTISAIPYIEEYYHSKVGIDFMALSVPACYSEDTEVLTNKGFVRFADLCQEDLVGQYKDNGEIEFVKPSEYYKDRYVGKMCRIYSSGKSEYYNVSVTPNHKMVRFNKKNKKIELVEAGKETLPYTADHKLIISGDGVGCKDFLSDEERLLIAFQADGSFSSRSSQYTGANTGHIPIRFFFKKDRKKERLEGILNRLGFNYSCNKYDNGYYSIRANVPLYLKLSKTFDWIDLSDKSSKWGREFIEELQYWDGSKARENIIYYSSTDRFNIEQVQAVCAISGVKSHFNSSLDKRGDRKELFTLSLNLNKRYITTCRNFERDYEEYDGYVYCVSVPSKMIVVKHKDRVLVCGNTEHSVMCLNADYSEENPNEFENFKRLVTEIYPNGIVSIVSDSFDYWGVISDILPRLKSEIMNRSGGVPFDRVVVRPDTGNPIDVICGKSVFVDDTEKLFNNSEKVHSIIDAGFTHIETPDGFYDLTSDDMVLSSKCLEPCPRLIRDLPEYKKAQLRGSIESLWNTFGGAVNEKGYRTLDSHIGLIYGDSITLERANEILKRLMFKGFASDNVVFGVGSYTLSMTTRDTLGLAVKATAGIINGKEKQIFKEPKTDDGFKKSARGFLRVIKNSEGIYELEDELTFEESEKDTELRKVFEDGKLLVDETFHDIRKRLNG